MEIETTTPRLHTVRVDVANLTERQARFLRSIISLMTMGGPQLDLVESGDGMIWMTFSGACMVTKSTDSKQFENN